MDIFTVPWVQDDPHQTPEPLMKLLGLSEASQVLWSHLSLSVSAFPQPFFFPPIPTFGGRFRLLRASCLNCWGQVPLLLGPPKPALLVFLRHCFGSCQTWHIKRGLLRHLPRVLISHNITPSLLDWLLKALPKLNQSYFFSLLLTCPTNLHVWSLQWATPCPLSLHCLSSGCSPHLECHSSTLASSHLPSRQSQVFSAVFWHIPTDLLLFELLKHYKCLFYTY